jgi:hypothetical protein
VGAPPLAASPAGGGDGVRLSRSILIGAAICGGAER